eukprot:scaffold33467_cov129-Isochrysis_galbana.AAC.1
MCERSVNGSIGLRPRCERGVISAAASAAGVACAREGTCAPPARSLRRSLQHRAAAPAAVGKERRSRRKGFA